jgi:redox-sensitive bicupin YhaK (pirin superfamily)
MDIGWLSARFTFSFADFVHPQGDRFGPVLALNEDEVQPGAGFPEHPHRDLEILMLPLEGAIAHEDSLGGRATVRVGQVLMMRAGRGIRHSQFNASELSVDRHLQLWIEPEQRGLQPAVRLLDVPPPDCGEWRLVAAHSAGEGAFALAQQAQVRLGAACASRALALELAEGESAFLFVVHGACEAVLPGAVEPLRPGESLAIESSPGAVLLRAAGAQRADFLSVSFPESLLLRNRTSAVVRAGR